MKNLYEFSQPGVKVYFLFNYSGPLIAEITEPHTKVFIFGIYIGKTSEIFNVHTVQHHQVGDSISDLFIRGIFSGTSKFTFEGLIKIDKGAQLSNAYQKNQNLLLSSDAYVDSRPFLEIQADDVRCTHGSTTGRLDKEQLEYVMSRGINLEKAEALLMEGFIEEIFSKMSDIISEKDIAPIRQKVITYL